MNLNPFHNYFDEEMGPQPGSLFPQKIVKEALEDKKASKPEIVESNDVFDSLQEPKS